MNATSGSGRPDRAPAQIADWWQDVEKSYIHPHSPQTHDQRRYVRRWAEPSREAPA